MQASPFAGAGLGPFEDAVPYPAGPLDAFRQGSGSGRDARSIHRRSLDDAGLLHMATSAGGGASLPAAASLGSQMGRSASVSNPFDVTELLARISLLPATPGPPPALASAGSGGGLRCLSTDGVNRVQWVQPSGPRRMGQGVEDVEQGVVLAQPTPTGGALLRVTLLAAGFLVGPSGSSVREICRVTGADVKSWTADPDEQCTRSCRVFRVEGPRQGVARAVGIMCDAVARYKELCEGAYAGKSVSRIQHVGGVVFSYQPPPRNIVPYAASLKGQSSARRQGSGRQGSTGAPNAKPPAGPRKASMSRSGSLGPPPASSVPAPSASLSRSTSLPQPPAAGDAAMPHAGSPPVGSDHAGGYHRRGDSARSAAGSRPGSKQGEHESSGPGWTQPGGPTGVSAAMQLQRSASAEAPCGRAQHTGQPMAPAPALKLEKGDVMRSLFGAADGPGASAGLPPAPAVDVTELLQQLMLQEAQQQASASALLGQQGVHGGYQLTEPGVLLPASLSPLAPAPRPLPPFSAGLASVEAQLAAQGLAGSGGMLAAVAAAWQTSPARPPVSSVDELLQLAAAGLLGPLGGQAGGAGPARQPSAGHPPLAAERSVPLAPHPSLDGAVDAALAAAAGPRSAACTSRGSSPLGAEQHLPLSAFQATGFTPFASVGSPPSDAGLASPHSGRSSESSSQGGPGSAFEQQEPTTPRQRRPAAGAVVTPGSGQVTALLHHEHATPDVGTAAGRSAGSSSFGGPSLASLVAAPQPMAPGVDIAGTLASAFALLPGGGELAGEPQGPAGDEGDRLSPFSAAPFLPLSGAALARAASTPGPQGSCSSIDRLHGMLAMARANSYAAPSEPDVLDAVGPPAHQDELGALEPQFAIPAPSHGSLFASAFSPRPRGLRQAPSLPTPPLAPPRPAARLGSRSASSGGALGGSASVYSEVDRLLDTMF